MEKADKNSDTEFDNQRKMFPNRKDRLGAFITVHGGEDGHLVFAGSSNLGCWITTDYTVDVKR